MKTLEEKKTADIIAYFKENEEIFNNCIEELDSYNGYLNDDRYYLMEDFNELHSGTKPDELLLHAFCGYDEESFTVDSSGNKKYEAFNPNRNYFRYNAYGNLVSADYKDYSAYLDEYAIMAMCESRRYIDSIEDLPELAALFDELETIN